MSTVTQSFSKILIAIDGSEQSLHAANYAITIAQMSNAELYALYVATSPKLYSISSKMPEHQVPDEVRYDIQNAKRQSQSWFNKISENISASTAAKENTKITTTRLNTEVIVSPISVVGTIVEYAERNYIDLIVMGTRGRTGFTRLLLGSTASGVSTYAHCPVLIVK